MSMYQAQLVVTSKASAAMLITDQIVKACPDLSRIKVGFLHLFLRHTSASLTINENADPDVRRDLTMALDHVVPESLPYEHNAEGSDDMPAHVKASLMGVALQIPVANGKLLLGMWQGIYLCEHRATSHRREIVCTIYGME